MNEWNSRENSRSWRSRAIRDDLISQVKAKNRSKRIGIIKTLVAIAPLLGLLGTVTGMIEVFRCDGIIWLVQCSTYGWRGV